MQDEIKILIIEDELIWTHTLAADLDNFGYTVVGVADNFESAVTLLNNQAFDIALVDINIRDRNNGIELGKMINTLYRRPFIFITANQELSTVRDALQANPSAYLVKPANPTSLLVAIQNALNNFHSNVTPIAGNLPTDDHSFFFVKQGDKYKKIYWQDIVYFRADKNYTFLFNAVDKTEYPIRSSLVRTFNYILPSSFRSSFLQVNRSEYVQSGFINELSGNELKTAHKVFTISDAFARDLKKSLNVLS